MIKIDREQCDECATCVSVCPTMSLRFTDVLCCDSSTCTSCRNCVRVCPFGALSLSEAESS